MASLRESRRPENKQCTAFSIFSENLTVFSSFIPKSGRKYSHTNSHIFAMIFIMQEDHLTAGARAASG